MFHLALAMPLADSSGFYKCALRSRLRVTLFPLLGDSGKRLSALADLSQRLVPVGPHATRARLAVIGSSPNILQERMLLRSLFEAAERRTPDPVLALPETAPKLYASRPKGQTIIEFLRDPDGWGPYVRAGRLSRPEFRHLDPQGEMALRNWLRTNKLPDDMHIPTKVETIDARLESEPTDEASLIESRRLLAAKHRRQQNAARGPT